MKFMLYLVCGYLLQAVHAAEIVAVMAVAVPSHHHAVRPILSALAAKGHNVTLYTALPEPEANYNQVAIRNGFLVWENITAINNEINEEENFKIKEQMTHSPFVRDIMVSMMKYTIQDPAFKELVESERKIDLLILASGFMQECFVALGHRFKAPVVDIHPAGNMMWAHWIQGSPADTSYMIDFATESTDEMTFIERLSNTANFMILRALWWFYYMPKYQNLMDLYLRYPGWETRPSITEMVRDVSLVLINSSPVLNYPYPMAPHFKDIGGINVHQAKPLPQDLQEFMDSAENGVIYFSLGSHISSKTTLGRLRKEFVSAFSKVKQKVLWKWDSESTDLPKNILIKKWFPQQSILAHKNLKIFISHGGFLSMTESMYYGVPIIGIPIMGDQQKNTIHMQKYKYGVHLHFYNLSDASITWAINEILQNPQYTENAKKKLELVRDRPQSPLDTAVYWIEYVLRHKGAAHLRPTVSKLAWYEEALIDVYAVIAIAIMIPLYFLYILLRLIGRICNKILFNKSNTQCTTNKKRQ